MAFNIGGSGPAPIVGNMSPRGNNRGAITQSVKGLSGGLPQYENTYDESRLNADSQYEIGMAPIKFRQGVFDKTFPLLQGLTGGMGGDGKIDFGTVGGTPTQLPQLPSSNIWNDQQVQQQVNNARAQGDAKAANSTRDLQGEMAGRGFSGRSPLAMALTQGIGAQAAAGNADQERDIRWNAAKGNADMGLQVGDLAQKQWSDYNTNDVQRRQAKIDALLNNQRNMTQLISAISGFGG